MRYSNSLSKKSSKIILGTAYFGETISKELSFEIMDTYFACGGCHIDTARMYADGQSERVIGEWLASRRPEHVFLSTKGSFPDKRTPHISRLSREEIRFDIEKSLEALGVASVDMYWLHRDDESLPVSGMIDTLNELLLEGKIKRFGASNWTAKRIYMAQAYARQNSLVPFSASQIRFSPAIIAPAGNADRTLVDMTENEFSFYKEQNMPVFAYASQAKGFFSKVIESGISALSEKSRDRYLCDENLKRLEKVRALSEKHGISAAATVCALLASIDAPDVFPIIGGSRPGQIKDSMSASDVKFEKYEIEEVFGKNADI